tara:strand:- start:3128 stop:4354 length:1227 start_codon:yes stop_codon:yes gene_type:complete
MFNPKGNNLLDEQLAVSGLEMNWGFAAIGAVASIAGGIMGSQQASRSNKAARKARKEQKKHNKKIAKLTNKHNDKLDAADKANYYAMREYSHETNLRNWQRGAEIQDFQYLNTLKQYQKDQAIGNAQLGLNAVAEADGIQAEQDAIKEAFIQQQFQHQDNMSALKQAYFDGNIGRQEQGLQLQGIKNRKKFAGQNLQAEMEQAASQNALSKETAMVESLMAQGTTQTAQAGKSNAKAQQANRANLHRSLMALESELSGRNKKAAIAMAEINADASLQELGVGLNLSKIENAIENAEATAQGNEEVLRANMQSTIRQAEQNIKQITLERKYADVNTRANMMLFPERLSYDPVPEMPPEREFVDRMEAIPGFVPPAQQQSTWAPLISGIASGASALAGANFKADFLGRTS